MECCGSYCSLDYSMQSSLTMLCRHLCLYRYNLMKGVWRRKGIPVLASGKVGAAWVFFCVVKLWKCLESCERTWRGNFVSPGCESGPTRRNAGQTQCGKPRDSGFLYADPCNGARLNMAQKDFYLLIIKIILRIGRSCFHWDGSFITRAVIISLETSKLSNEHNLSFLNEPTIA